MSASYAAGPTTEPLLEETIGANLRRMTERFGGHEALVVRHQNYRATYAQLAEQVDRAARAFIARGVANGDRVGIWAPNRHEWVVTQFAMVLIQQADQVAWWAHIGGMAAGAILILFMRRPGVPLFDRRLSAA